MIFSISFESRVRFEIGRYLLGRDWSRLSFFGLDVIIAYFSEQGKWLEWEMFGDVIID